MRYDCDVAPDSEATLPPLVDGAHVGAACSQRYIPFDSKHEGGFCTVYPARDVALDRVVAFKELLPHLADIPRYRTILQQEGVLTSRLTHPNIVRLYDVVADEHGRLALMLEFIRGETLDDRVSSRIGEETAQETQYRVRNNLRALMQVADALRYAHGRRVIHRDLKPANVMLRASPKRGDDVAAVVIDWGCGARSDEMATLHDEDRAIGTPSYMSPEQSHAEPCTPATDVFGVGATLYTLFARRPPFLGESVNATLIQASRADFRPLHEVDTDAPKEVSRLCERAMSRNPRNRPTMDAVLMNLKGLAARIR